MYKVTLIEGDGIGREVSKAALAVLESTGVRIEWERCLAGGEALDQVGTVLPSETLESIRRNRVALKGPLTTPIGSGFRSANVALRRELDLYASLRPVESFEGLPLRYKDVSLAVVRENIEDLYLGIEHMIGQRAAESVKLITAENSERICRFAMEYAHKNGRHKVTAVHKANVMKLTDGLFLESCRRIAAEYPEIEYEERIIDDMCMQLVRRPHEFEVLVAPNLYGDILSDLCAGLVGGLGVAAGANYGNEYAVFEPGHGSAPKYAGTGKANPTAMILSAAMMLDHLGEKKAAQKVREAIKAVFKTGAALTQDLGGSASCQAFAEAVADEIGRM